MPFIKESATDEETGRGGGGRLHPGGNVYNSVDSRRGVGDVGIRIPDVPPLTMMVTYDTHFTRSGYDCRRLQSPLWEKVRCRTRFLVGGAYQRNWKALAIPHPRRL
ncbi:hypothetical protein EYF80_038065 [Liparis tanakae]|uniref:Uncharacterized protein n=1 Tax=Liparis tanakae TaxID=230148 RepID=A0A4Z2GEW5_9TELE|nr:hypothetical protein EYF80_038065 [Liparis tanakae]